MDLTNGNEGKKRRKVDARSAVILLQSRIQASIIAGVDTPDRRLDERSLLSSWQYRIWTLRRVQCCDWNQSRRMASANCALLMGWGDNERGCLLVLLGDHQSE
jgi:hypothetical protein